jgi:hypothetical protein
MKYMEQDLREIYDKFDGTCPYCGNKIAFSNYGMPDEREGW